MKKDTNKKRKPINGWKLTAILSLIVNGIVALLLTIGLAQPKASVKVSAYNEVYDTSKIVLTTNNINRNNNYYFYFDWINQSVEGSDTLYYFPISNDIPSFGLHIIGLPYSREGYSFEGITFMKSASNEPIYIALNTTYNGVSTGRLETAYYIPYGVEPRSTYLEAYITSETPNYMVDLRAQFRAISNGSILLSTNNVSSIRNFNFDTSFLYGYFTQYSVQNLEVGLKTDSNIALNQTDFSTYSFGVYGMSDIENVTYTYLQSTLIHSDSPILGEGQKYALMPLLNGSFYAKEQYSAVLVGLWKEIYWPTLPSATSTPLYYDLLYNGQRLDKSNGYYYYLDSINFYNVGAEELGESIYSVTTIDYQQEFQWTNGYCYYTTKLQQSALNPVVIRKVNLYPSQRVQWINFSNIFDITNHFYFGNGIIDNPSIGNDNNINGSNTAIGNVFVLIKNGFESIMPLLGLTILPNITIGMLLFLPLIGTIIIVIIKLVKR